MPITLEEILESFPELRGKQPVQKPLANQNQPAPAQPAQQPAQPQPPAQVPALPASLGQMAQPQGLGGTLGNMAKSFLGTMGEALPSALANYALFGSGEMGQRMTYASMVNQLEKKREEAERRRQEKVAGISTFLYSMQQYGKNYNVKPEDIEMALMTGTKTGVTEIDNQIGQAYEAMQPMIQSNEINSADILEGMKKRAEYVKLMEGEKPTDYELFQQDPEEYKKFKEAGREPNEPPTNIQEYNLSKSQGFKGSYLDWIKSQQKPDKPETPTMREVWPTGGGESIWIRNDVAPPSGYTGIKPERAPKAPTPQQALKNIAQQEKIIYSLKNTGGIPPELLGNVSPETLKLLQGGDPTSAIQAAQDVIDYNRQILTGYDKVQTKVQPEAQPKSSGHPLSGKKPGRYMVNGKEVKWDGQKEIK